MAHRSMALAIDQIRACLLVSPTGRAGKICLLVLAHPCMSLVGLNQSRSYDHLAVDKPKQEGTLSSTRNIDEAEINIVTYYRY